MSSVVCQGLQSCLEPRLVEPRVLRHKLSPPKSSFSQSLPWPKSPNLSSFNHFEEKEKSNNGGDDDLDLKNINNGDVGGWSFIQALTNTSQNYREAIDETQKVYVHPLDKRSSSSLSSRSLEMCTESLGSETGSDISETSDEFSSLLRGREKIQRLKRREFGEKVSGGGSGFPPPLTSISGSDGVQVRPRREGGRLVLQAVTVSSSSTYFTADRTDGRLRLSLLKDCSVNCDEEELYDDNDGGDSGGCGGESEVDDVDGGWDGDSEGNCGKVGGENGIGELARPSRCKEGGSGSEGIQIWVPFPVAIS